jgi:hypothetical protein
MMTPDEKAAVDAANEAALAAAKRHRAESAEKERIQRELDEALAASFPASDPVSIVTSQDEEAWREPPRQSEPQKPGG